MSGGSAYKWPDVLKIKYYILLLNKKNSVIIIRSLFIGNNHNIDYSDVIHHIIFFKAF